MKKFFLIALLSSFSFIFGQEERKKETERTSLLASSSIQPASDSDSAIPAPEQRSSPSSSSATPSAIPALLTLTSGEQVRLIKPCDEEFTRALAKYYGDTPSARQAAAEINELCKQQKNVALAVNQSSGKVVLLAGVRL